MVSFGFFTLAISYLVMAFHFDPNILRLLAVIIIGFLGLSLVIPSLNNFIELLVGRLTSFFGKTNSASGFGSGFITGLSLGIVWSPCAGPILAAIATLAATSAISGELILITLSYILGIGIPLFLFAYGGQSLFNRTKFISKYTGTIQKIFGVIMILTAVAIYTNYDKVIQTKLLNLFPDYTNALTNFGNTSNIKNQLDILRGQKTATETNGSDLPIIEKAPDFTGGTKWLNSSLPLSMSQLQGKVVLVDFWTYTCINCIRTLPFVTHWYDTYKDKGFVVIGVHTPEFSFEHDTGNVQNAITMFKINYPVVQDNDYAIWNSYANQYWPAEYLIDAKGYIRHTHFGEGEYDNTEQLIVQLLKEAGNSVQISKADMPDQTPTIQLSPETYLGSKRMEFLYPNGSVGNGVQQFNLVNPSQNMFSYGGTWEIDDEQAVTVQNSKLNYNFYANKVYLVITPKSSTDSVTVFLDGKLIDSKVSGADVKDGKVQLDNSRLYNLVDLHGNSGAHMLRLEFSDGISVFAFTFG